MKKILLSLFLLCLASQAMAQIIDRAGRSVDPARLYLQQMRGTRGKDKATIGIIGSDAATVGDKSLDPLTQRRREMRAFVPQGNWFYGIGGGFQTMNTRHTDMAFSGMKDAAIRLTGYAIQPYLGYAVGNNCIIGLRAGYSQTSGLKDFFAEYNGEEKMHTYTSIDYHQKFYTAEAFWRGYVPIDSRLRWALFADVVLGYQGGDGYVLSVRDNMPFRSNFSLNQVRLGVRPGVAFALTNNLSFDFSLSLADVNYSIQREKNRDGADIRTNGVRVNSLLDVASFQFGVTINH